MAIGQVQYCSTATTVNEGGGKKEERGDEQQVAEKITEST